MVEESEMMDSWRGREREWEMCGYRRLHQTPPPERLKENKREVCFGSFFIFSS